MYVKTKKSNIAVRLNFAPLQGLDPSPIAIGALINIKNRISLIVLMLFQDTLINY